MYASFILTFTQDIFVNSHCEMLEKNVLLKVTVVNPFLIEVDSPPAYIYFSEEIVCKKGQTLCLLSSKGTLQWLQYTEKMGRRSRNLAKLSFFKRQSSQSQTWQHWVSGSVMYLAFVFLLLHTSFQIILIRKNMTIVKYASIYFQHWCNILYVIKINIRCIKIALELMFII